MKRNRLGLLGLLLILSVFGASSVFAIGEDEDTPPVATGAAVIQTDEGGPVLITGTLTYTNALFTLGTAQPLIILEDQAGFVDRNEYYLLPPESQVLGQITSDYYTSPFSYSLSLPSEPQGGLRDVDNDGQSDTGVMVFAVAYWTNVYGDAYLEKRDLGGGGWSTGYVSTRISSDPDMRREVIGGIFVIYAPDANQGFPSGFGADGKLFTADDPIVSIPQGYTIVNMDTTPFTYSRPSHAVINIEEDSASALDDFSTFGYADAFDKMVDKLSKEYAFTEYKGLDWEALRQEYRGRFVAAETTRDNLAYTLALRDFIWEIKDGHVSMAMTPELDEMFQTDTGGGFGIAIREVDDGRIIVNYLTEGSPAAEAGIELGAEIVTMDGQPVADVVSNTFIWAHVALGAPHVERLQQLRYASRRPVGTAVEFGYKNPGSNEVQTATLTAVVERESFSYSSFNRTVTGTELPVEFRILDSGYGYVSINSFSDNEYLTVQLWERMITVFKDAEVPGIIIDMRNNGGGSLFLANQMAAYFFNEEPIYLGRTGVYLEEYGDFYFDPNGAQEMYLPAEELRYHGAVVVIVAPQCFSACEFFSYDMTVNERAAVVGQYPSGGLGGSVEVFLMPDGISIGFTRGRALDMDGNIHIEGKGVVPTVKVPVTEETLFAEGDVVLDYAQGALVDEIRGDFVDAGELALNAVPGTISASGMVQPNTPVQYTVTLPANSLVDVSVSGENGTLNTVLNIYDPSGIYGLATSDNVSDLDVSSAIEGIEPGDTPLTIIVEVTLADGVTVGGNYTLTINAASIANQ